MKHRMKRILIFSLAYYPHVGGAEVALKEITDRIPDIEFHMITLRMNHEKKEEKIGNIFVHRTGNGSSYLQKILFIPRAAAVAARLHKQKPFDASWAMMSYMLFPIVLLRWRGINMPYLLTLQEGDPWEHMFSRWFILPFRPLLSCGFKNATAIQTISTFLSGWAKQAGFLGTPEIIGNGVDVNRFAFTYSNEEIVLMQKKLQKKSGDIFLVTSSRLVHKNAIDDVIHALQLLPQNINFVICGIGPDEVMLKRLADTLSVSSRVHFMGQVEHKELPAILKACDIFIRPSRSEGMGNSFIEAMAAGLPVIATQEGGISDFLFDAKRNPDKETTGWAVDKDSPEQIVEAVKDIIAHPEQVARVKETAIKLVSENYNWDFISQKMHVLLTNLR